MPKRKKSKKVNLNLGCGIWLRKGFINVDKYIDYDKLLKKKGNYKKAIIEDPHEFVKADIKDLPFEDNYADYVEMMNTIEHFPIYEVVDHLSEIHRVMKPGADFVIQTNSFDGVAVDWLQMLTSGSFDLVSYHDMAEVIYGNQRAGSEGEVHRCPFTPRFLNYVLTQAGFKNGSLFIIPRGAKIPTIGTVESEEGVVARNDLLVAQVKK